VVYLGGLLALLFAGGGIWVSNNQSNHKAVFDDAMLCEARGGAWVHDASVPLCMTPNDGLLELVNGSFRAFTSADPWEQPYKSPFEGKEFAVQVKEMTTCTEKEAEIYDGRVTEVDFSSWPDATKYRTAITKDVKRGVNFAGSYIVSTWGCARRKTDACVGHAIMNARTGDIVLYDVIGRRSGEFSLASNRFSVMLQNGEEKTWSVEGDTLVSCKNP
jgi:hypothetical protein